MKCIQKSKECQCIQYIPNLPKFWVKLGELLPNKLYKINENSYDLKLSLKLNDNFINIKKGEYIIIDEDTSIDVLSKEKFEKDYCIIKEIEEEKDYE